MKKVLLVVMALGMLIGGGCQREKKETITISGAWALYPMVMVWKQEYEALHPEVIIEVSAGGAGKGMTDALSEVVDIGMISREIHESEVKKGAFYVAVAKDAVVPVMNADNPVRLQIMKSGIKREFFKEVWWDSADNTGEDELFWQNAVADGGEATAAIHVFTRSDACGAAETWARYMGLHQEDLRGYGVFGDPNTANAVRTDINGIGYNNINFAYTAETKKPAQGITVIPIDLNGNGKLDDDEKFYDTRDDITKAIADGRYPSPPSRDLYFVTQGQPKRQVVKDFIEWTLTDGQKLVEGAGYINLSDENLKQQTEKLSGK